MDAVKDFFETADHAETFDGEYQEEAARIREVLNAMLDAYISDDTYEDHLRNLLEEDDYLSQELVDKIGFLSIVEGAPEGTFSKEEIENVYLSVMDSFFELSKIISPLEGFGKDRLLAGLDLIREFEEEFWPLYTRIVPENAPAFSGLIPAEHYDDILTGKKQALGALRHVGEEVFAAGAVVYGIYGQPGEDPILDIDWIGTHENLRARGIANFLMALLVETACFSDPDTPCDLVADVPVRQADTEDDLRRIDASENFFDSWKFGFSMAYGSKFVISFSDLKASNVFPMSMRKNNKDMQTLSELGKGKEGMLKAFFDRLEGDAAEDVAALPYDFFDPDVSFAMVSEGEITSLVLFHRFSDGNYRYEGFYRIDESHKTDLTRLLTMAYQTADKKGIDGFITGSFADEKAYELAVRMVPCLHLPMVYRGIMSRPTDYITSEEWGQLREQAGFSNNLLPEDGPTEDDSPERDQELIKLFVSQNGFKVR